MQENNQVIAGGAVDCFSVLIQYEKTLAESLDEDIKQTSWTVDEQLAQADVITVECVLAQDISSFPLTCLSRF